MYQIDVASAATALPASTAAGTPGFFTDGNPATGVPATIVPAEYMNALMLEILNVITAANIAPAKGNHAQLLAAINAIVQNSTAPAATTDKAGVVKLATAQEGIDGVDTVRAIVPAVLAVVLSSYAKLSSPALTGTPTAPTAGVGTNNTQIANTAFMQAGIAALISGASGDLAATPAGLAAVLQGAMMTYAVGSGSANAHTATYTPAVSTLVDGMVLRFRAANANTGSATFSPNGLAAKPILTAARGALSGGEIAAGADVWLQYNASLDSWISVLSLSSKESIVALSADTVLTAAQMGLVLIDASAGARAITLPEANAALGVVDVIVRRIDNSGNRLKVQASGTDKIKFHTYLTPSGYPFLVLMGAGDWWHLRSDGAGSWWPVGRLDSTALGRPVFETTTTFSPGGYGALSGAVLNRADWPWLWDHAQASGMLTTEAARVGMEGGWTSGDGSLTFRGPEGRGEFLRVWDETRGADPGRAAGSWQKGTVIGADNDAGGGTECIAFGVSNGLNTGIGGDQYSLVSSQYPGLSIRASTQSLTPALSDTYVAITRPRNIAYPGRIKLI